MPAASGSPTQNVSTCATPADLAGLPDDQFKSGDLAYVASLAPDATFRLNRASVAAVDNVTVIATRSGNGRWEIFPPESAPLLDSASFILAADVTFLGDAGGNIPQTFTTGPFTTTAPSTRVLVLVSYAGNAAVQPGSTLLGVVGIDGAPAPGTPSRSTFTTSTEPSDRNSASFSAILSVGPGAHTAEVTLTAIGEDYNIQALTRGLAGNHLTISVIVLGAP